MRFETEVNQAIAHWGPYYGVTIDPGMVHGILERETAHGTDPNYIRNGGAVPEPGGHYSYGPMQVYDDTVATMNASLDPQALADSPALGIWYGVHWLGHLLKQFPGDPDRAIAAYNAGAGNARRNASGAFPNQGYVDAVKGFWARYGGAVVSIGLPALALAGVVLWMLMRRAGAGR